MSPIARRAIDALVEPLGDAHRPLGGEAELAAGLLLQGRGRERRRRARACCFLTLTTGDRGCVWRSASAWRRAVASSPMSSFSPSMRTSSAPNVLAAAVGKERLEGPVLLGLERVDLALALDDEAHGDGLDPPGARGRADLTRAAGSACSRPGDRRRAAPAARRRGPGRSSRGCANASRIAGSVISLKVTRLALAGGEVDRLGDVPGDGLALAVEVGGEVDLFGPLGGLARSRRPASCGPG